MGGRRILSAWLVIALLATVGWLAASVYADRHVAGLDRDEVCAYTGVALGDTMLRSVERARRDSAALADRNCSARFELARRGRELALRIRLALVVFLSALVTGFFSLRWAVRRARTPTG